MGIPLATLLTVLAIGSACAQSDWKVGRATFYGTDGWSIHRGSCGFYYIFEDSPLGWDVAALTDVNPLYAGSCGSCFEVKCNPSKFKDGNGEEYDRTDVCKNPDQSIVFRITDTCPCNYATNAASNKRWCCGDMTHFDMSIWAYEKLADTKWGVIGLQWRAVPCDYKPANPAPALARPTPGQQPPKGTQRPPPGYWNRPRSQWPGRSGSLESDGDVSVRLPGAIYNQTLKNNWTIDSYNAIIFPNASALEARDRVAQCAILASGASFTFKAPGPNFFLGKLSITFWAQYAAESRDLQLTLASSEGFLAQGTCAHLVIADLIPSPSDPLIHPDMLSYTVYLGAFQNSSARAGPNALAFQGCPGIACVVSASTQSSANSLGVSPAQIDQVIFTNTGAKVQQLCLDNVLLLDGNA